MKSRTRMSDIAEHAQVSVATVSRVVNGTGQVSDETRHRVLVAIDSLGYERPATMRAAEDSVIGIIVPELTNPVFATYAHFLQSEISRANRIPIICTQTPGSTSESDYVRTLVDHQVSGIVFVSGRHADLHGDIERYHRLIELTIPYVTINGTRDGVDAPDFSTDDAAGIGAAVKHLADHGHERIALLTGQSHLIPAQRKIAAFRTQMKSVLGQTDPRIIETFYTYEAGAAGAKELLAEGVTGIICASDLQALGAIRTAHSLGLDVPGDASIIGFDDTMLMAHTDPALTSVRQPIQAIARAAIQTLETQLKGASVQPGRFEYTPDLVVRASTGPVKHS